MIKEVGNIINLKISKTDRTIYNVIEKFRVGDMKYRIKEVDDGYYFQFTNPNCRYFVHTIIFKDLVKCKNFIFTSDCP